MIIPSHPQCPNGHLHFSETNAQAFSHLKETLEPVDEDLPAVPESPDAVAGLCCRDGLRGPNLQQKRGLGNRYMRV